MRIQEMLATHPRQSLMEIDDTAACISACVECADVCTSCADACLGEEQLPMLRRCIQLDLDCADICQVTARIMSRQTEADPQILRVQLEACATACRVCAEECERHAAMHRHCGICAMACRACEQKCRQTLTSLPVGAVLH